MTADEEGVGRYFRTAVDGAKRDVAKVWNRERKKDEWKPTTVTQLRVKEQAYGLCGLVALYSVEPSAESLKDIDRLYAAFRDRFEDKAGTGFFDLNTLPAEGRRGTPNDTKSFNSTVYVATAFLMELHDAVRRVKGIDGIDAGHRELASKVLAAAVADLLEVADAVADKMIDADETVFIVEEFDRQWAPDWRGQVWPGDWRDKKLMTYEDTTSIAGHNFQAAWFLLRASRMPTAGAERAKKYSNKAAKILRSVLAKPEGVQGDLRASPVHSINGGFQDVFRRRTGAPIYHTNKAWWQQAEGILALTLAEKLGVISERTALDARDKALQFYVNHFVDREKVGEFAVVTREGNPVRTELKGQTGKSSDHTVELYRYLIEYAGKD